MKRTLSFLTAAMLLLTCFFGSTALAEGTCTLSISASEVADGKVTATVSLDSNPGITAIMFAVNYDSAKLALVSTAAGSALAAPTLGNNTADYAWSNASASTGTGTLMTLTFSVIEGDWTSTQLTLAIGDDSVSDASGTAFLTPSVSGATVNKPKPPHVCIPGDDWKHDSSNHWKECTAQDCDKTSDLAPHAFDEDTMQITKPATAVEHGEFSVSCDCGYVQTGNVLHFLDEDAPYEYDANNHWAKCAVPGCSKVFLTEKHVWDNGTVTKEPTASAPGEKTFSCTAKDCNATKTQVIPALGQTTTDAPSSGLPTGSGINGAMPDLPANNLPLPPTTGDAAGYIGFVLIAVAVAAFILRRNIKSC